MGGYLIRDLMLQRGRPPLFDVNEAWEIYTNLLDKDKSYGTVAQVLTERLALEKPLSAQAIAKRFYVAGLIEKMPRGRRKLENPQDGATRSRRKRYRDLVFDAIPQEDTQLISDTSKSEPLGVGRPRQLDTNVAVQAYKKLGSIEKAAGAIGFSYGAVRARLQEAGVVKKQGRPLLGDRALSQTERNKRRKSDQHKTISK